MNNYPKKERPICDNMCSIWNTCQKPRTTEGKLCYAKAVLLPRRVKP